MILNSFLLIILTMGFSVFLEAQAHLVVLINHREFHPELVGKERYKALALANRACDKGNGVFGHAWIWIYAPDHPQGLVDLELGHTGETDPKLATYFEALVQACLDKRPNPVAIFQRTRPDGACQLGSGGHYPQVALSYSLDENSLNRLLKWIEKGDYDFSSYNLTHHQCCHFVIEALKQVGIDIDLKVCWRLPQMIQIATTQLKLWTDPAYQNLEMITPFLLAQTLKQKAEFDNFMGFYLSKKKHYSIWPWKRIWQKRALLKQLLYFAPQQIERSIWSHTWQEGP